MTQQDNIVTLTTTEGIASLITRLRKEESNCASVYIIDASIETIERLVKERDEARREACARTAENLSLLGSNVRLSTLRVEHAARRGWDCFKEKTL